MIPAAWVLFATALAADVAPCALDPIPGSPAPGRTLFVQVIQINSPDRDPLESAPDIYGDVVIDGKTFKLPEKPDTRNPTWDADGRFMYALPAGLASVTVDITVWDRDTAPGDDEIYLGPIGRGQGRKSLHLDYAVCEEIVSGDIADTQAQNLGIIPGPGGEEGADILLALGSADGVPLVDDDVAIMDVDLVQVVPKPTALVADKPTALAVTIGNSFKDKASTTLTVTVTGGGVNQTDVFPVTVEPMKSASYYFYVDAPLRFTAPQSYVSIDLQLDATKFPGGVEEGCRQANDRYFVDGRWKVVRMTEPKVMWIKTGANLDTMVAQDKFDRLFGLGNAYILGTYPVSRIDARQAPGSFRPKLTGPVSFLATLISQFIPGANIDPEPALLIWELGLYAGLSGYDRAIGVLPDANWFTQYSFWSGYHGLSLATNSRAVIVLPEVPDGGGGVGMKFTGPAHELGHTYGLSVQPELREEFFCKELARAIPLVGAFSGPDSMGCGLDGGLDEKESDDPTKRNGWPAPGIWLAQGGEPPEIAGAGGRPSLLGQPQCDRDVRGTTVRTSCFMGQSWPDQVNDWAGTGRWIDRSDYGRLFRALATQKDPEVLFVSAIVGPNGETYEGPWFHHPEGTPDPPDEDGIPAYGVRFYDAAGTVLGEDIIRTTFATPVEGDFLPATFIQVVVPWRHGVARVELRDRFGEKALVTRTVSANAPTARIESITVHGHDISVRWTAQDPDGDKLQSWVEASSDGENFWPVLGPVAETKASIASAGVRYVRIHVHDGIHTGLSEPRAVALHH